MRNLNERKQILDKMGIWDRLLKELLFEEFQDLHGLKILDYGCGEGHTAQFLGEFNDVTAIEPNSEMFLRFDQIGQVRFIQGDETALSALDEKYDLILCHNVLEYVKDQKRVLNLLADHLKKDGMISIVKHNRPGRVMQMAVLLNNFDHAHELLDGKDSDARQFGTIHYYEDEELVQWDPRLMITRSRGFRAFYDLQQDQKCHAEKFWQDQMMQLEKRVMEIEPYKSVAFFHILECKFNDFL